MLLNFQERALALVVISVIIGLALIVSGCQINQDENTTDEAPAPSIVWRK